MFNSAAISRQFCKFAFVFLSYSPSSSPSILLLFTFLTLLLLAMIDSMLFYSYAQPAIKDSNLKVEILVQGLEFPTSMAFLAADDILVLEKNEGAVKRIVNGQLQDEPLLYVNVDTKNENGLLGIAIAKHNTNHSNNSTITSTNIFLYYTERIETEISNNVSSKHDLSSDIDNNNKTELRNRLYKYDFVGNKLVNPIVLLDLPTGSQGLHNGGNMLIGSDNNIYLAVGNLEALANKAQNHKNGADPDGSGGILRIAQNGKAIAQDSNTAILGNRDPLSKYYAYGIRNSFGMDFDTITNKLWDTENGPSFGDEINLVEPGFNSGYAKLQGVWERNASSAGDVILNPDEILVDFNSSKGNYSSPEFIWYNTVGVTALKFLNSDKLGRQYENDIFVGDYHNGYLYHFDLNKNRTALHLEGLLEDKIANSPIELQDVIFGEEFGGGITDLEVGPDGCLYILASNNKEAKGSISRIAPILLSDDEIL
jgi:glucose/arabinose dehydrogenase